MKKREKLLTLLLLTVCALTFVTPVGAYSIGDVIDSAVYTDIIASINDYNIASYNINGSTAVVAEDLINYGFSVTWVSEERALYIKRNSAKKVASTYIAPSVSPYQVGKKAQNVLYTDIKTYINGAKVNSYNINGKTIINFDDLAVFGNIVYDDTVRRLDLSIDDGLNYKISAPCALTEYSPSGLYFKKNSVNGLKIRWEAYNNTNKTINYYTTTYYMFNAVRDFAYDWNGRNSFSIRTVGPVNPGETLLDFTGEYEVPVTYANLVKYVLLNTVFLEYSDGTCETIYYNYVGQDESEGYAL